jgi:hypothetical protein
MDTDIDKLRMQYIQSNLADAGINISPCIAKFALAHDGTDGNGTLSQR